MLLTCVIHSSTERAARARQLAAQCGTLGHRSWRLGTFTNMMGHVQLRNGAVWVQLLDVFYPHEIPIQRV